VTKTLVLLHGWSTTHESLYPLIQLLQPHFKIYSPDLPYPKDKVLTLDDYCQFVIKYLKKEKITHPILIGHSLGGAIATKIAIDHPELPLKIVLLSTASVRHKIPQPWRFFQALSPVLRPLRGVALKIAKLDASDYVILKTDIEKQTFRNLTRADQSAVLPNITIPTLILWGLNDTSTPISDGRIIHSLISGSQFFAFPGNHFFYLDHPREVVQKITSFVSDHESS
jgi:pimeloyl-ACP methyl ester carboxylesterase